MTDSGFKLTYDSNPSPRYPNGYWYACTEDGGYDATGSDPLQALASLVTILTKTVKELLDPSIGSLK